MILVDTSIWIDHLRSANDDLSALLEDNQVFMHPWVRGELALGSIKDRSKFIGFLHFLPALTPATDAEILKFIDSLSLYSRVIGWVDAGLLASCYAWPCRFWTRDLRLHQIAQELGIAFEES